MTREDRPLARSPLVEAYFERELTPDEMKQLEEEYCAAYERTPESPDERAFTEWCTKNVSLGDADEDWDDWFAAWEKANPR